MPRRPRLVVPGIPMHITQRGVNRTAIFFDNCDYRRYLDLLIEIADSHAIPVHAYALMGNHVHLLITVNEAPELANAMRLLNQRYVSGFNRRHERTGTLWESRFRSCLVDSEGYLLTVYRYIDLNPVRASIVESAERYPWSSARRNMGFADDVCVTPHLLYQTLGADPVERATAYREWMDAGTNSGELVEIRAHTQQERALGSETFKSMLEGSLKRSVALRSRGRPRKDIRQIDGIR